MNKYLRKIIPGSVLDFLRVLRYVGKKLPNADLYIEQVDGRRGVEIGGPSTIFKTLLPLYKRVSGLDGVNFSCQTVWEGRIEGGKTFNFIGSRVGHQYIADATDLSRLKSEHYDFLISSNCLEHVANPIKALFEWKRVVKKNGVLIIVLPNKINNFDRRRHTTSFQHMLDDYNYEIKEDDLTHLEEILENHDLGLDSDAGTHDQFRIRSLDNVNNRTLHHHVFDKSNIIELLNFIDVETLDITTTSVNFYVLARKKLN